MPKLKKKKYPINLKSFRERVQSKVSDVGSLRAAEAELGKKVDHSTIARICNGEREEATLHDFLWLLEWVGGEMPKW